LACDQRGWCSVDRAIATAGGVVCLIARSDIAWRRWRYIVHGRIIYGLHSAFACCAFSDEDKAMLAKRGASRSAIMTDEARVLGPASGSRKGLRQLALCIQFVSFNVSTPEIEQELLAWFADWRMSALSWLPGCIGMRKMVSAVGWNRHGVMYEFTSLETRAAGMAEVARLYPEMEAWTQAAVPRLIHAHGSPHIARRSVVLEK
jgi:hypothetical protein